MAFITSPTAANALVSAESLARLVAAFGPEAIAQLMGPGATAPRPPQPPPIANAADTPDAADAG
ncbi:MAG: hypothetical protein M1838_005855, partial [Thelocarpon superellum]